MNKVQKQFDALGFLQVIGWHSRWDRINTKQGYKKLHAYPFKMRLANGGSIVVKNYLEHHIILTKILNKTK